jgi:hypothetical protein
MACCWPRPRHLDPVGGQLPAACAAGCCSASAVSHWQVGLGEPRGPGAAGRETSRTGRAACGRKQSLCLPFGVAGVVHRGWFVKIFCETSLQWMETDGGGRDRPAPGHFTVSLSGTRSHNC